MVRQDEVREIIRSFDGSSFTAVEVQRRYTYRQGRRRISDFDRIQIRNMLHKLEQKGEIRLIESRPGGSNGYTLWEVVA